MKESSDLPGDTFSEVMKRFFAFLGVLVFLAAALIGISLMMGQAKQDDLSQENVLHASCVVKDKELIPNRLGRDYNTYKVATSCGNFVTGYDLFDSLNENETYDLITTVGNWANKPTIISFEP